MMAENEPNEELYLKLSKEINRKLEIKSSNIIFSKILELALIQLGVLYGDESKEEQQ